MFLVSLAMLAKMVIHGSYRWGGWGWEYSDISMVVNFLCDDGVSSPIWIVFMIYMVFLRRW